LVSAPASRFTRCCWRWSFARAGARGDTAAFDPLLLLTSVLGLLWNLCSLPGYVLPKFGIEGPFPLITAIGFGALGLLPAAVVHSVLRGNEGIGRGVPAAVVILAYAVRSCRDAAARRSAARAIVPSSEAMRLLTYVFVVLVVPLAAATRGQRGARRALWVTALACLPFPRCISVSCTAPTCSWPVELLGHHASLPLALASCTRTIRSRWRTCS
jgi:hypothetical protein